MTRARKICTADARGRVLTARTSAQPPLGQCTPGVAGDDGVGDKASRAPVGTATTQGLHVTSPGAAGDDGAGC